MFRNLVLTLFGLLVVGGCTPMVPDGDGGGMDNGDMMSGNDGGDNGSGGTGGEGTFGEFERETVLTPFDPQFEDLYGDAVAIFGDNAIVGTEHKNTLVGIADVYLRFAGEWRFIMRLDVPESRSPEQGFGSSVAISNRYAFVGAYKYAIPGSFAIQTGAVHVFRSTGPGYELSQTLVVNDAVDFENIGRSMAYDDSQSRFVVGAPGRNSRAGAVYVYSFNGNDWIQEQRLEPSDGTQFSDFGISVAMSGVRLVCGASNQNFGTGAAYVFERDREWTEVQRIVAFDADETDAFGHAVAIEGDVLAVSANAKQRPGDELLRAGAVYIYQRVDGRWEFEQKLTPNDDDAGLYGQALALNDGKLAVGLGSKSRVAIFEKMDGVWTETSRVGPGTEMFVLDSFGNAIGFSENSLMVGARSADEGGQRAAGAAYIFSSDSGGPDIPDGVRF